MGNIVLISKDNLSAWTGGKPLAAWIGLNPSISNGHTFPNQLRPVHTSAFQQGYNYHSTDIMITPFSPPAVSLISKIPSGTTSLIAEWTALAGYLCDPECYQLMTNFIKVTSVSYTIQSAKALSTEQLMLHNKYDKTNNRAAIKYMLLSSHLPARMCKIK